MECEFSKLSQQVSMFLMSLPGYIEEHKFKIEELLGKSEKELLKESKESHNDSTKCSHYHNLKQFYLVLAKLEELIDEGRNSRGKVFIIDKNPVCGSR
jgi:hypothetical protein